MDSLNVEPTMLGIAQAIGRLGADVASLKEDIAEVKSDTGEQLSAVKMDTVTQLALLSASLTDLKAHVATIQTTTPSLDQYSVLQAIISARQRKDASHSSRLTAIQNTVLSGLAGALCVSPIAIVVSTIVSQHLTAHAGK